MKVAVITRHAVINYGSLLQAFAIQQVIESLGHECKIIDYIRDDESYTQLEKTLLAQKPEWNSNLIKRVVYLALRQSESIASGKKFEVERLKYLHLTKRYTSPGELVKDKPIADVYMTGSDQVWGPVGNGIYDSSYCLAFTNEADKRIAYAASFGRTEITKDIEIYFKKWLKRYCYIGVREDSAVAILSKLGINGVQVLDPTLLLDSVFWSKIADSKANTIKEKEYILVYQLHNDKRVGAYAAQVAKSVGLPLIRISSSFHQISREGKFIWCPDVARFLSYVKNAECMITDSFHGTAFAINFNTPFVEVLPNNKTGTRNMSILKLTGLSDRILTDGEDITLAKKKIDYFRVNRIIEEKRRESLDVLKRIIED